MEIAASSPSSAGTHNPAHERPLLILMMGMFFAFGFCTVLVDSLTPKMKELFGLNISQANLLPFAYFTAYAAIAGFAGKLVGKIGYLRAMTVGLLVVVTGCVLFIPAGRMVSYTAFLGALFIMAGGVTIVQVAANPLTASLGKPQTSSARLTLAQAFNSFATFIGPIFGTVVLLAHSSALPNPATVTPAALTALRIQAAQSLTPPYLGIAGGLILLALVCWVVRRWAPTGDTQGGGSFLHLLGHKRLVFGAIAIFTYVGAEVAIGSNLVFYLKQPTVLGPYLPGVALWMEHNLPFLFNGAAVDVTQAANTLLMIYWGGAMVGRFIGSAVLSRVKPSWVLVGCTGFAILLAITSGLTTGLVAGVSILAIGLFNSIQFPTIFTQAIEGLGDETPGGSGLLCIAIWGGAWVPLLLGVVADLYGFKIALIVPVVCYAWIAYYGFLIAKGVLKPV